ncbi:MAG TPA: superoxide dismutase family protein [Thermoanaerobaculia bacterium]|nr:superoxide dismutase family protein [Thermoanaerobaculia bacterium]
MRRPKSLIVLSLFALVLALGCAPAEEPAEEEALGEVEEVEAPAETTIQTEATTATAILATADGTEVGTVTFTETPAGVQVSADFHDVAEDGLHGFHVHEIGECSPPDFTSAGGHFNPENVDHACPPTTPRHAGDFGNVSITGGTGLLDLTTDLITVAPGPTSVVGKAVMLHAHQDDCTSQPTGDAGGRYACGVVEIEGGGMGDMGDHGGMHGEGDGEENH